jgi:Leucine-rich repeat (LRR) protein
MVEKMSLLEDRFKYSKISDLTIRCGSRDSYTTTPWFGYLKCKLSFKDQLKELPEELLLLTDLETLKIEYASELDLDHAFTLLSLLPKLRKLHLRNCALAAISPEIRQMENLFILDLGNNYTYLPSTPDTPANSFSALPSELGSLIRLQELYLTSVPGFVSLPAEVTNLTRLVKLSLRGIKSVPRNIELIPHLKYLDLVESNVNPVELIPLVSKQQGLESIVLSYLYKTFDILKEYNPNLVITAEPRSTATGEY